MNKGYGIAFYRHKTCVRIQSHDIEPITSVFENLQHVFHRGVGGDLDLIVGGHGFDDDLRGLLT